MLPFWCIGTCCKTLLNSIHCSLLADEIDDEVESPCWTYAVLKSPLIKETMGDDGIISLNPDGDYVAPELITVMVNEEGPHCTASVYAIAQKNYERVASVGNL